MRVDRAGFDAAQGEFRWDIPDLKVIVRDAAKGAEWSKRGAEVAVGSLEDAAFLTTALKGAKGFFIFH